jgi:uncharacterized linocin/CFP29 family protein
VNLLKRHLAPITPEAWKALDDEATQVLKLHLAARKVVDFDGPHGWNKGAVNIGRRIPIDPPRPGVDAKLRRVQPLVELKVPFRMPIAELDDVSRGAKDIEFEPLVSAAKRIAAAEDNAVFEGYTAAGIGGIVGTSEHRPIQFGHAGELPGAVMAAKEVLRRAGVGGPYALLLGPSLYDEVYSAAEGGFPIRERVQNLVNELVWAPSLSGSVLLSTRGNDFELTVGQDLSVGYTMHDGVNVELYLTESMTFRVLETTAAISITERGRTPAPRKNK